ncbi:HepT-like ribonuclease domain-containing protein [Taylorella asinigenitalis]|uniref:HepT-like ribonuclease domain-containing protein n=1 Tax=Taylorella asinigenitalis TaxID=84590 RepID=UPI003BA99F6F
MRHRLVHGYNEVDVNVVWETLQEFLPKLVEAIPSLYKASHDYEKKLDMNSTQR